MRNPRAQPAAAGSARPGRATLTREVGWFVVIGAASTVAQGLSYWVLRHWWPPLSADFVSLVVVTVLNTEANRRLTFRGSGAPVLRTHLAAGGLFVLAYLVTSGAVLLLRHLRPTASTAAEIAVLVPGFALVTVVRFTVLRLLVFRRR
ncbi:MULTISPECIES: GtrA family protein [unclassified Streptomyces]|uniref:GtrA family protein n=1 Tax=unclassified Streptomyces TaxID=2593676 RepID=UPI000C27CE25|nr:GtrA family protein [Streptomyces sp. CB02959]PJN35578.1 hypothetical protein CG747_37815 [Streptomyces sp. CB02959]